MNLQHFLIGTAIGDAFGAGVEFQDRNWIRKNVDFTQFINARKNINVPKSQITPFIKNYNAWDYTDDTEMTIGTMKALISKEEFTESLLIKKWSKEYYKGVKDKSYGRNGHGSMAWYYAKEKTIEEIKDFQRNRPNPGNAPAMRATPIGFIKKRFVNKYAAINANATHPNINAILSSQCIARATRFILIEKGNPKNIIHYCKKAIPLNKEYRDYLTKVNRLGHYEDFKLDDFKILCGHQPIKKPYFLSGIHGIPSDSKYTAGAVLFILKTSRTAMEALKKSIYLGGDVDSIASITTGIIAAKEGLDSLPSFMLENIEGKNYLKEIAKQFEQAISQL